MNHNEKNSWKISSIWCDPKCYPVYLFSSTQVDRFSFDNLAEPEHIRNLSLFGSGSARLDIYSKKAYRKHQRNNPIYTKSGSNRVFRGGSGQQAGVLACVFSRLLPPGFSVTTTWVSALPGHRRVLVFYGFTFFSHVTNTRLI
ncbi:MAG: hypothetical protein SCARUB_00786 [Candidatus Scalindua rubra]|uniref:Uncharacterized protein n=1 Tax=Candidatus Scalindua rubra TaxID=1872076 RepID=A0A1E3XEQ6_9BACT|nr:MAG: hypothetical protein SCARUB_00786 [Candidatus Scalindua rubra]